MKLEKINIKNFRNFKDEEIYFNNESLVIGPNDVGKTNLLYALRIMLDKSLSNRDLELEEKDFNVFSQDEEISIKLKFTDIKKDKYSYIIAKHGKYVKEETLYILYKISKKYPEEFKFYMSATEEDETFTEIPIRGYINDINCVYLNSTRQLSNFLKTAKSRMIENYKKGRTEEEKTHDDILTTEIKVAVEELNKSVEDINYINKPTEYLKKELREMSFHNDALNLKFSAFNDYEDITENIDLVTEEEGKRLSLGGDGRNNQIYMSMWINEIKEKEIERPQFTIILIEEPESHLHFPLQSMTVRRLIEKLDNQIIMTTHSAQIVLEFNPSSIIRMYFTDKRKTAISNKGCSDKIDNAHLDFGYRNNLISGTMYYSDAVILIEGNTELLLYKELARQLNKEIEKYNISIISVDGVGFFAYSELLKKLNIQHVIRTDNDIQKLKNGKYYYYGISRLIEIYNSRREEEKEKIVDTFKKMDSNILSKDERNIFDEIIKKLNLDGLYLSNKDLENDLVATDVGKKLMVDMSMTKEELVDYLQSKKATKMYEILKTQIDLKPLVKDALYDPLRHALKMVGYE